VFTFLGDGACRGTADLVDPGSFDLTQASDTASCARLCLGQTKCLGFEYRISQSLCEIHHGWVPSRICPNKSECLNYSSNKFVCYARNPTFLYYKNETATCPGISDYPTASPTSKPTSEPTTSISSASPTSEPTTSMPTPNPTSEPTTSIPSASPTSDPTTSGPAPTPEPTTSAPAPTPEPTVSQGDGDTGIQPPGISDCVNTCTSPAPGNSDDDSNEGPDCNAILYSEDPVTQKDMCQIGSTDVCDSEVDFVANPGEFYTTTWQWQALDYCVPGTVLRICIGPHDGPGGHAGLSPLEYCLRICDADSTCRQLALVYDPSRTEAYIHQCSEKEVLDSFKAGLIVYQKTEKLKTFENAVPSDLTVMTLEPPAWQLVRLLCGTFLFCGILFVVNRWFRKFQMGVHGMQHVHRRPSQRHEAQSATELSNLSENVFRYLKTVPYVQETKGGPLDADTDTPPGEKLSDNEICCSICLEPFTDFVTKTPCGHMFHRPCIEQWLLNTKKECPNCRHKIYASPPPEPPSDEERPIPPPAADEEIPPPAADEEIPPPPADEEIPPPPADEDDRQPSPSSVTPLNPTENEESSRQLNPASPSESLVVLRVHGEETNTNASASGLV